MTTYEELDRTIYEHIRRELVRLGHLPDRKLMNATAYTAALQVLRDAGNLIEVYGQGSSEARDYKESSRITLLRNNTQRGTLGAYNIRCFKEIKDNAGNVTGFKKVRQPSGNKNVIYEIRSVTVSTKHERIMITAINTALGYGDYIPIVDPVTLDDSTDKIEFLAIAGDVDISTPDFIERLFTYQFLDVWVDASKEETGTIVPITEINWSNTFPAGTPEDNQQTVN